MTVWTINKIFAFRIYYAKYWKTVQINIMHSIVYQPSSHLRDGGGMFSGRLKYIINKFKKRYKQDSFSPEYYQAFSFSFFNHFSR